MATLIHFHSLYKGFRLLHKKQLTVWLTAAIKSEKKKPGDITIIFCDDNYLLQINKQYLDHHYFTDIITFDYSDNQQVSGDLFVSIDRIKENAQLFQCSTQQELRRVMVHGVLHLCGYKDKSPKHKKEMTAKEDFYLNKLKLK